MQRERFYTITTFSFLEVGEAPQLSKHLGELYGWNFIIYCAIFVRGTEIQHTDSGFLREFARGFH